MLDGLLGRGFAAKCKSLIKATKARIELIRRKRSAREKFLKKDIADLLANGLDTNAFGRIEGLMTELTLSSCYNFVEECCDIIYKQLSAMQKQSECPAECKEAVASLMFSAARVSDLPELRDLRETFQEKYGNSLQYCVNQKFVEDLSSPAPTMENKIQLMQDIAAEYSVSWNCRAFHKQMSKPPVHVQPTPQYGSIPVKDKVKADGSNSRDQKDHILSKVNYDHSSNRNGSTPRNGNGTAEEVNMHPLRKQIHKPKKQSDEEPKSVKVKESHQLQNEAHGITTTGSTSQLGRSSYRTEHDHVHRDHQLQDNRAAPSPKREVHQTLPHVQQAVNTPIERLEVRQGINKDSAANLPYARKSQDADKLDPRARTFNKMVPPPYVKSPKVVKAEIVSNQQDTGCNGKRIAESPKTSSSSNRKNGIGNEATKYIFEKETSCANKGMGNSRDGIHIDQNNSKSDQTLPKPKSVRQHSSRSSSGHDGTGNHDVGKTEKRSSRSKKRSDSKQGLRILFDDEPGVKDDERVLDKLLIHLSTKPTNFDPEKLRRMSDVQAPRPMPTEAREFRRPNVESKVKLGNVTPLAPHSRSVSLSHEQAVLPGPAKVFTRAASFQPDRPAKHVHPNMPDCDDLAARIAVLRGSS